MFKIKCLTFKGNSSNVKAPLSLYVIKLYSIVLSFQSNLFSILVCKIFFTRIITRSNSFPSDWTKNVIKKMLFKKLYQLANLTIVNSVAVKKKFKKFYNINSTHIYNPINKLKIIKQSKKNNLKVTKKRKFLEVVSYIMKLRTQF